MENNKVSIIVPIYNTEKYLKRCIESIINQTYSNLEVILVNDGSTDDSIKICKEYAKKDSRIILVNKENGGLSDARNKGLDLATGEYISFVDGDDFIHISMIEELIKVSEAENADIVHCDYEVVDEQGNILGINNKTYAEDKKLNAEEAIAGHIIEYKIKVVAWNKLYKKELFKELRFKKGYIYEDEFLFPQIISLSKKNIYLNKKLYFYVSCCGSITKSKMNLNKIKSNKELMKFKEEFYMKKYLQYMRHIYMSNCMMCYNIVKQIKLQGETEKYSKEILYFNNTYKAYYEKMIKTSFCKKIIYKKELFCLINYLFIKFCKEK